MTPGQGLEHLHTWFYPSLQGIFHCLKTEKRNNTSQITLQKRPNSGTAPAVAATRGAAGSGQAAKVQTGDVAGRLRLSRHCRRRASITPAAGRRRRWILPARAVLQPACTRLTYHPLQFSIFFNYFLIFLILWHWFYLWMHVFCFFCTETMHVKLLSALSKARASKAEIKAFKPRKYIDVCLRDCLSLHTI